MLGRRYFDIDTENFVVNESPDAKPMMMSPDEGIGELNISGVLNQTEYILPDVNETPEKRIRSGTQ